MPKEDLAQKLQQIRDHVAQHAQGSTEIADVERLLLSEVLGLGQALLKEFIEQKKLHAATAATPGPGAGADAQ